MSNRPTLRSRVWNILRTARDHGRVVSMAALVVTLNASPAIVYAAVQADTLETPEGQTDPPIYCEAGPEGLRLTPRYFPGEAL